MSRLLVLSGAGAAQTPASDSLRRKLIMSLTTDSRYENICHLIEDFEDEVNIHKSIVETAVLGKETPCPMLVFYHNAIQKDYLIVVHNSDNFNDTLPKLSEALHLYQARNCHSVLVMLVSKIALDDVVYDSVNFFVASENLAYVYYLPFTVEDNSVTWHDDRSFVDELATAEMDQNGLDFLHVLHAHVHMEDAPFEASEVLTYLSYNGFAIQSLNPHNSVSYIDMSTFDYQTATPDP